MKYTKYTLPAAGSLAMLSGASNAHAMIIVKDDAINVSSSSVESAPWNIDGDGTAETTLQPLSTVTTTTMPVFMPEGPTVYGGPGMGTWIYMPMPHSHSSVKMAAGQVQFLSNIGLVVNLSSEADISGSQEFRSLGSIGVKDHAFYDVSGFTSGEEGYLGFSFNPTGVQELYGWARVTFNTSTNSITISEWAYEDSGSPIQAGQTPVPEPAATAAGLGALALGAAGLRSWRKRKV